MVIAEDSGNRSNVSILSIALSSLEMAYGDPLAALDYSVMATRNYFDSGGAIQVPLAVLAAIFDRLGRYEPAATIAGFAASPLTTAGLPELNAAIAHFREVLGDKTYESLAQKGHAMTAAAMAAYAYYQIDQARQCLRP